MNIGTLQLGRLSTKLEALRRSSSRRRRMRGIVAPLEEKLAQATARDEGRG